jgi:nicotinamide mononucleotide transporter
MHYNQVKISLSDKMQAFQLFGQPVSILECLGFATGIIGVWLTIKQNILCFPVGIINVTIYSFIFFKMSWHANALLQIFYIGVLIYGWMNWKNSSAAKEFSVTAIKRSTGFMLVIVGVAASVLFGFIMKETTNNPLPYWDATTTSMSLIAQWMVAEKKIENWLLWLVADIIYVGMCLYQSLYLNQPLYLTAVLYFIFLILAIKGYAEWKKTLQKTSGALH